MSSKRTSFGWARKATRIVGLSAAACATVCAHADEGPDNGPDPSPGLSSAAAASWSGNGLSAPDDVLQWPPRRSPATPGVFESRSPWTLPTDTIGDNGLRSASYSIDAGLVRVVPKVVVMPNPDSRAPGLVAVGLERSAPRDPLLLKAQLGWSGAPNGSFEAAFRGSDRELVLSGEERPSLGIALPGARAPGAQVGSRWTERLDARTSASARWTDDRLELEGNAPHASSAAFEVLHRPADHWTLLARVDQATYSDAQADGYRRAAITAQTGFDVNGLGMTAAYRNEVSPAGGAHGGRVALGSATGPWRAGAYADVQQWAQTIEFMLSDPTELPADVTALGLAGMRPEALVQAMRDHATLINRYGWAPGALRLDPLRLQGGFDVAWRAASRTAQFGVRVAYDELDGSGAPRRAVLGNLYATWRVFGGADLTASYANWSVRDSADPDENRTSFRMTLRAPL